MLPLDLFAEVETAAGVRYRWDANRPPKDRLRNFSFRTKLGEGFSDAGGQLARRIDQDFPDLALVNTVRVVGGDGSVAYEGRISALPRELSDSHSIGVTLTGWMAHAKDRKFSELYVDRDLSGWHGCSAARKAALLTANSPVVDPDSGADPTDSTANVTTHVDGVWASPYIPVCEAWYDAGPGLTIGKVVYSWSREAGKIGTAAPWAWTVGVYGNDKRGGGGSATANLAATGPTTLATFTPATPFRYAVLDTYYNGTPGGVDGARFAVNWSKLAVYGGHGMTTYAGEPNEPPGYFASDVIKDIAHRWCPELDTSGVVTSSYVIQHLVFKDRTFPYDAFLELNKFHLWHLGVWENKTLHWRPYDLTDYDWEVRTDDPGTTVSLVGDSIDDVYDGAVVTYDDILTGIRNVLTPDDFSDLKDTSAGNPWVDHGVHHWLEIELSTPTLQNQALQIGRAALASANRPKTPGSITVTGYIRDRAGAKQPGWKVRAGDTVAITNYPNASPRLIHETSWDDSSKQLQISVEAPAAAIDALFDRIGNALGARGLT